MNAKEIMQALIDGEMLDHKEHNLSIGLDDEGDLISDEGYSYDLSFSGYDEWTIHKEPEWYENIPDGGVLCMISDHRDDRKILGTVISFNAGLFASSTGAKWRLAKPLSKKDIQVFMDNAPDE